MSQPHNFGERKVFRCPNCRQFISTDVDECRFCSTRISDEIKLEAVKNQENEDKGFRVGTQKKWLYAGIGVFSLGVILLGVSLYSIYFTADGRFFIWSPILILIGFGQIIYSLFDIYHEKK